MREIKITDRLPFLGWIILPILGVLLATNYIYGLTRKPTWAIIDKSTKIPETASSINYNMDQESFQWKGKALLTFWFDDAWMSQYTEAFPKLNEKDFKAALAVPTDAIGWENYMTWAQIKRLSFNGWEITSHSKSHECDLSKFDRNTLEGELSGSQNKLLEKGYPTFIYVAPCGVVSDDMLDISKDYYLALRATEEGLNDIPVNNRYDLHLYEVDNNTTKVEIEKWINEAQLTKKWLIIMFHEINDSGLEYSASPDILDHIIDYVDRSDIEVVLPSQVLNI